MRDGIYTHRGEYPLDSENNRPMPLRRLLFLWGTLVLGLALLGMTVSGIVHRRRIRRERIA
jgi:hypothetical protein